MESGTEGSTLVFENIAHRCRSLVVSIRERAYSYVTGDSKCSSCRGGGVRGKKESSWKKCVSSCRGVPGKNRDQRGSIITSAWGPINGFPLLRTGGSLQSAETGVHRGGRSHGDHGRHPGSTRHPQEVPRRYIIWHPESPPTRTTTDKENCGTGIIFSRNHSTANPP